MKENKDTRMYILQAIDVAYGYVDLECHNQHLDMLKAKYESDKRLTKCEIKEDLQWLMKVTEE